MKIIGFRFGQRTVGGSLLPITGHREVEGSLLPSMRNREQARSYMAGILGLALLLALATGGLQRALIAAGDFLIPAAQAQSAPSCCCDGNDCMEPCFGSGCCDPTLCNELFSAPPADNDPDNHLPSVALIKLKSGNSGSSTVSWDVYFRNVTSNATPSLSGVDVGDFALVGGVIGAPAVTSVSAPQAFCTRYIYYTVTASTAGAGGPMRLKLVDDDSIVDSPKGPLGGAGAGNGDFTGPELMMDATTISVNNASLSEGDGGSAPLNFTLERSGNTSGVIEVSVETNAGSSNPATAGSDYTAIPPGTKIVIPAGQTSVTVPVSIIGDTVAEPDETFFLHLTDAKRLSPPGTFSAANEYPAGTGAYSIASADLNGDGKLDLVTANYSSDTTTVLLNQGDGTFNTNTFAAEGLQPVSVAIADVDGDDHPELIVANQASQTVSVLFATDLTYNTFSGGGNNNYAVGPAQNLLPLYVTTGDLNGDGFADIVTANHNDNSVSVLLGIGNGQFSAASIFSTGTNPRAVAISDINCDGKPDLVVANGGSNNVSVLAGDGTGSFSPPVNTDPFGSLPIHLAVGDLNNDGKPDVAVANYSGNYVKVLAGNCSNALTSADGRSVDYNPSSVAIADLNGDGRPDLAVAYAGGVSIVPGNGDLTLGAASQFSAGGNPRSVVIGDFDGDGKPDLATAKSGNGKAAVLMAVPDEPVPITTSEGTGTILDDDADTTPNAYSFTALSNAIRNRLYTSNAATITGINTAASISITGGNYSVGCTGTYTASATTINNGQTVCVRVVSSASYNSPATATLTIGGVSADYLVTTAACTGGPGKLGFAASSASVNEAAGSVTLNVTRSVAECGSVGLSYATVNSTAAAPGDYTATSSTLSWAEGDSSSKAIVVAINNDALGEATEAFRVQLSSATGGASLATGLATVSILDDDSSVQFAPNGYSVAEEAGTITLTVQRVGAGSGAMSVNYATSNVTALAGSDYSTNTGTLSWANGDTANKTIVVSLVNDAASENTESFRVSLSNPTGASLARTYIAQINITDTDTGGGNDTLKFSPNSYTVNEAAGTVTLTATRTGTGVGAASIDYQLYSWPSGYFPQGGVDEALPGSDFTGTTTGTLSWANGDTAPKTIPLGIVNDTSAENTETFAIEMTTATGAQRGNTYIAVVTVTDND